MNVRRLLPVVPPDERTRVAKDRRRAFKARVHRAVVLVLHVYHVNKLSNIIKSQLIFTCLSILLIVSDVDYPLTLCRLLSPLATRARGSDLKEMISYWYRARAGVSTSTWITSGSLSLLLWHPVHSAGYWNSDPIPICQTRLIRSSPQSSPEPFPCVIKPVSELSRRCRCRRTLNNLASSSSPPRVAFSLVPFFWNGRKALLSPPLLPSSPRRRRRGPVNRLVRQRAVSTSVLSLMLTCWAKFAFLIKVYVIIFPWSSVTGYALFSP